MLLSFLYHPHGLLFNKRGGLMQQPRQRHGDDDGESEGGPVAQMLALDIAEHKMAMYEVCLKALGVWRNMRFSTMMAVMVNGMYIIRSTNSGKRPWRSCSRYRQVPKVVRKITSSNHTDEPGSVCLSFTYWPILMPIKKMGTRLQKISICPTAA